jgi:hypothetical protein
MNKEELYNSQFVRWAQLVVCMKEKNILFRKLEGN